MYGVRADCSPHPRGWSLLTPLPRATGLAAPRTRGDGPNGAGGRVWTFYCSPHPRGWSLRAADRSGRGGLLPAPAGMVPPPGPPGRLGLPAPRTRGDGPRAGLGGMIGFDCSPHPRDGPSVYAKRVPKDLLPAPAGMVPRGPWPTSRARTAPRTRGDGPITQAVIFGAGLCSPHPRGWSLDELGRRDERALLPAPAGMVPTGRLPSRAARPAPAPRTRGGGPWGFEVVVVLKNCSPHPRGWSHSPRRAAPHGRLLPAPARDGPLTRTVTVPARLCPSHARG